MVLSILSLERANKRAKSSEIIGNGVVTEDGQTVQKILKQQRFAYEYNMYLLVGRNSYSSRGER